MKIINSRNALNNFWIYDLENVFLLENGKLLIFDMDYNYDSLWNYRNIPEKKGTRAHIVNIIGNGIDLDFPSKESFDAHVSSIVSKADLQKYFFGGLFTGRRFDGIFNLSML